MTPEFRQFKRLVIARALNDQLDPETIDHILSARDFYDLLSATRDDEEIHAYVRDGMEV